MNFPLLETGLPLTVIGGGDIDSDALQCALSLAPICVAADGGADTALSANVELAAVIGDMDSISEAARAQIPHNRQHLIAEQDSTDFDKVLRSVAAPLVVAVGFTGGRIDHELSALHTLVAKADRLVVLLAREDIIFLCPSVLSLPLPEGTRVSLFPMRAARGRSRGLHWPIDGIEFAAGLRSGTSNRATGHLHLEFDEPGMLCILPKRFIRPVVSALLDLPTHARWPAP